MEKTARELARRPRKPAFTERCQQVEQALRRLGIDPTGPDQVLVQVTPSGGRHYYFSRDASLHPDQTKALLEAAGLHDRDGEIELYPRASRGLRLPFGHVPSQLSDPRAWLNFTKAYQHGRIKRFSLQELYANLERHQAQARTQARPRPTPSPTPTTPPTTTPAPRSPTPGHTPRYGTPKAGGHQHASTITNPDTNRYHHLVEHRPKSAREAEELLAAGIRCDGTRTKGLLRLAIHLIWHRHLPEDTAREQLTAWAMDPRHDSKDIQKDRARGTNKVPVHIKRLCIWVAKHQWAPTEPTPYRPAGPAYAASKPVQSIPLGSSTLPRLPPVPVRPAL